MIAREEHRGVPVLPAFICGLVFGVSAWGVEFAGGTGEPNDPYLIATATQLLGIEADPQLRLAAKHYKLIASIDLGGIVRSDSVIGLFRGSFDGNGHTIRNLRIETGSVQGLFTAIDTNSEVRNLGITNVYVVARFLSGGLAGENRGRILNCYSTGRVISGEGTAGGLVGENWGTITASYSTAAVTGGRGVGGLAGENWGRVSLGHATGEVTGDFDVGGLVGTNSGEIFSSYATGMVIGTMWRIGGLAGRNGGTITASYANATVTGDNTYVGGLVGNNGGVVSCCYAIGQVTGEDCVGGLTGSNGGRLVASYASAAVESWGWNIGGLVGYGSGDRQGPSKIQDGYFLAPEDGGGPDNSIGTPLTDAEMRVQDSFMGWDFWGAAEDGTQDLWFMPEDAYPVLVWQTEITGLRVIPDVAGLPLDEVRALLTARGFVVGGISYDFYRLLPAGHVIYATPSFIAAVGTTINLVVSSAGTYDWSQSSQDGTEAHPYQIQTPGQLESLTDHPELWNKHFVLAADLDMVGRTYAIALIAPDPNDALAGFQGMPFSGVFDGQGRTIRNLTIVGGRGVRHDYVGLFGMVAWAGRVENVHLLDVKIEGGSGKRSFVGALVGYNAGTVADCSVSGVIDGGNGDGLVGFNSGTISNCQVDMEWISIP